MTNKEALNILKDRKIAYEVVITRTASHENRHMAEEELKLINACIIALEHMRKNAETVDAIPIKWIEEYAEYLAETNPHEYDTWGMQHEYLGIMLMVKDWNLEQWRKENESNSNN